MIPTVTTPDSDDAGNDAGHDMTAANSTINCKEVS
jgi:hypothetical protein